MTTTTKLTLGFSSCPNDTFIFYALLHDPSLNSDFEFEPVIADVEQLNRMALETKLDITKISVATYPLIEKEYAILDSGAALGFNCGPILITKPDNDVSDLSRCTVAIPGKHTTANLLLSKAFPEATDKREMLFSEIEDAILSDEVNAGVIIHENRFTYKAKGLQKGVDLGEWWHEKTGLPIALGVIVMKRSWPDDSRQRVDQLLRQSVTIAREDPPSAMSFVQQHAQEMDEDVMQQHIALYVNDFTVSLGASGHDAIRRLIGHSVRE